MQGILPYTLLHLQTVLTSATGPFHSLNKDAHILEMEATWPQWPQLILFIQTLLWNIYNEIYTNSWGAYSHYTKNELINTERCMIPGSFQFWGNGANWLKMLIKIKWFFEEPFIERFVKKKCLWRRILYFNILQIIIRIYAFMYRFNSSAKFAILWAYALYYIVMLPCCVVHTK